MQKAFIENDMGMKVQVLLADLSRSGNPPPKFLQKNNCNYSKPETGSIKLDLHGQRAEKLLKILINFI